MIGSTFKHRDGGWTVSIHGGDADAPAFEKLLRWLMDHEVQMKEATEETRRYERARLLLDTFPDVAGMLEAVAEKIGGTKIELLAYAVTLYEAAVLAIERGEQVALLRTGGEIGVLKVDIPVQPPSSPGAIPTSDA